MSSTALSPEAPFGSSVLALLAHPGSGRISTVLLLHLTGGRKPKFLGASDYSFSREAAVFHMITLFHSKLDLES